MKDFNGVVTRLISQKPSPTYRIPAYISMPSSLLDYYKKASRKAGVDMAFILRQAIPAYLDSGIDAGVLREWDQVQANISSVQTSVSIEMHKACSEIAEREGVKLVAVYRAALAQMFEMQPNSKGLA